MEYREAMQSFTAQDLQDRDVTIPEWAVLTDFRIGPRSPRGEGAIVSFSLEGSYYHAEMLAIIGKTRLMRTLVKVLGSQSIMCEHRGCGEPASFLFRTDEGPILGLLQNPC